MPLLESIPNTIGASLLQKVVRVELLNDLVITGRITFFDPLTMNLQLINISQTARMVQPVVSSSSSSISGLPPQELLDPPHVLPATTMAIRGSAVRYLDVVDSRDVLTVRGVLQSMQQQVSAS